MTSMIARLRDFVAGCMALFHTPEGKEKTPRDVSLEQGKRYYQTRQLNLALLAASESLLNNPDQRDAYILRGMCFLYTNDDQQAIEDFTEAIRLSSQHTRAYFFRATCSFALQDFDFAIADLDEAIRLHEQFIAAHATPDDDPIENIFDNPFSPFGLDEKTLAMAYLTRGEAYRAQDALSDAFEDFLEALRVNAPLAQLYGDRAASLRELAHSNLGSAAMDAALSQHFSALMDCLMLADLNEMVARRPAHDQAYFKRGIFHFDKGDYQAALHDFSQVIEMFPQDAEAYFQGGRTHSRLGEDAVATAYYTKAIRLKSEDKRLYIHRGVSYERLEDYDRAIADFTVVIKLDPQSALAYNNRAAMYNEKGEFDQALIDVHEALRLDPALFYAYNTRGQSYVSTGQYDLALSDVNEGIRLNADHADPYFWRGVIAQDHQQDYRQALADYDMALSITTYGAALSPKYRRLAEARRQQVLKLLDTGNP